MAVENKVLACIFSPEKTGFEFFVPLVITIHFAVGKFLSPLGFEPKPFPSQASRATSYNNHYLHPFGLVEFWLPSIE